MMRTEMYQNGEYFDKNPDWDAADAIWKVKWIKQILDSNPFSFNKVVDNGCGAGALLEQLRKHYPSVGTWEGYDISPQAIELTKKIHDKNIAFCNVDFLETPAKETDLLLTIDVVEHVADYYGFLEKIRRKSKYFIFHIPLDLSCRTLLKPHVMLQQRESVGHIHYFSKEMILWMLKDTGYEVVDWIYTQPLLDLLPQKSAKEKIKKTLRKISFSLSQDKSVKYWGGYSMMILAK